jgi:hypothetical protein
MLRKVKPPGFAATSALYSAEPFGTLLNGDRSTWKSAKKTGSCTSSGRHPPSGLTLCSWYSFIISSFSF